MKLELTEAQILDVASKIFDEVNEGKGFGELKNQNSFVRLDWMNVVYEAIDGYDTIVKYVDFPGVSIVKNCCRTCRHVDLYRPACNLRGDDICLSCVCSHFELFEFEDEDKCQFII